MSKMRRWDMSGYGMSNLQLSEVPRPEPQQGEVLVKVAAVSLNVRDQLVIDNGQGAPIAFPFTPASDMAGTVAAIGQDVEDFAPGDRVISSFFPDWLDGIPPGNAQAPDYSALGGRYQGVLADYVALPKSALVRAPGSLSMAQASTLPCAGLPAWFALVEGGRLRPGERVLVQGTGGVALFAVQKDVAGIAPVIDGYYDMEDLSAALAHLARGPFGKVVVNVDGQEG